MKSSKEIYQENLLAINKVILKNQDKKLSEIASILNSMKFKTSNGTDWKSTSVNYYSTAILKLPNRRKKREVEGVYNYNSILNIILENKRLKYSHIADILDSNNLQTERGCSWTAKTVGKFLRNEFKINKDKSPLGITIDKLEYSNSSLNEEEHINRFNKNILNQLDKIEPKVTPELEIEVLPNYEI